jgi:hypothetical protein
MDISPLKEIMMPKIILLLVVLLTALSVPVSAFAQSDNSPDRQTVSDAYVYLLGRALVIRQEQADFKETALPTTSSSIIQSGRRISSIRT